MPGYDEERLHPANGRQQLRDNIDRQFQMQLATVEVMFEDWRELNGSRANLKHLLERLNALQEKATRSLGELNSASRGS